ncbi:MAG TPA: hypothetical protein VJP59_07465 [Gemmatimonadota bacterium]|nr:hypothetical protein [Gemmatimonadota bacterium]
MKLVHRTHLAALALLAGSAAWACSGGAKAESTGASTELTEEVSPTVATVATTEDGSVEGQVVDVSCYLAQGLKGEVHRQCAEICTNDLGIPLNILDDDGTLWQLVDDDMPGHDQSPTVVQYAEQRVRATGTLIEKGGNKAIIVKDVALLEGTANPTALANSSNPELGKTFNNKPAANPCAGKAPGQANPCAGKANPCAANPCGGR